jgi:selenocysteine lyase/cysteine desulfurase
MTLAKERGVTIRSVPFDLETGELVLNELEQIISNKTRLLAIGAASNALGTITPLRQAAQIAHSKGALCYVDAVHYAAHKLIDVKEMQCDFLACSPYKFYGPHAGVLYCRADVMSDLDVPKLDPAPNDIPDRVETGTQNHEGIVGSAAAVDFLASLASGATRRQRIVHAMTALHKRGEELFLQLWSGLSTLCRVKCYGPPPARPRTPTASFEVEGVSSARVAKSLANQGIFASNGNFYAATVVRRLGVAADGLVRAGCACYTTENEVERLLDSVKQIAGSA